MSFYEINFSALHQINPLFASTLPLDDTPLHYEVFMDENSIESLNLVHTTLFKPLYDIAPNLALAEQTASFEVFQEYPYFYFFGLGNGVLLKYLLSNQRLKRIVVIEPDPQIAYIVLHMIDFSQEIHEGRLVILGQEQLDFPSIAPLFKELEVQRYVKLYYLHVMSPFYEAFQELIHQSNRLFIETIHHTIVLAGNDTTDALIGLKHHMTNLPSIAHTPPLLDLIKKVGTTDVAVLVSTGPSLAKQLPLLKKIAPYVRIFAVDASLPILIKHGIKPDVVTSIERVALTSRFFEETPKEAMKGIVTVLSSLQHAEVIDSVQGSDVIISLRPLGYMRVTGPKEWGYIGIGMSAANMAYELIFHSHFKTCILIGQDLAYGKDGKSHASGHVFGENDVKQSEIDGWTVAYGGEGKVKTTDIWNMFRGFFEKDIAEAKARMETINATEGGARIFGAIELPFEKALSLHVKQKSPKSAVKLSQISPKDITTITQNVMDKVTSIEAYLHATQHEVETLFLKVAQTCDALDAKHEVTTETMHDLLEAIDGVRAKSKEEIFDKVIWHIAQSMMLVQEITIAPIEVRYAPDEASRRQKMVDLLHTYKGWLFSLAGCIDAIVKTMDYGNNRALIHTVHAIDVWFGNTKIDTFTCKDKKAQKGRVFDVDMRGILYDVPDEYVGKQVVFKDVQTSDILPEMFVRVIDRMDKQYNELRFMASFKEQIDKEKIKDLYCPNAIGFLATKENLDDKEFMNYIKELMVRFPGVTFKAFYFRKEQEILAKRIFETMLEKIKILIPENIYDVAKEVEIYICNDIKALDVDLTLFEHLRLYCPKIVSKCSNFNIQNFKKISIKEFEDILNIPLKAFMDKAYKLGFADDDIAEDKSFTKTFQQAVTKRFGLGEQYLNDNMSAYEYFNFNIVTYALKSSSFKYFYYEMVLGQIELLYGKKV